MCHTLLSACFTYSFFSFTTVRDTCDSKVDLVQKQFFIFNNYLFQLNFFNFWCHTCHTFRLSCCESTTYIISRGVTHGVTQCHARCHAPRITVHGGRIMSLFRTHLDMSTAYSWRRNPKRKLGHYKDAVKSLVRSAAHTIKLFLIRLDFFLQRRRRLIDLTVIALVAKEIYDSSFLVAAQSFL